MTDAEFMTQIERLKRIHPNSFPPERVHSLKLRAINLPQPVFFGIVSRIISEFIDLKKLAEMIDEAERKQSFVANKRDEEYERQWRDSQPHCRYCGKSGEIRTKSTGALENVPAGYVYSFRCPCEFGKRYGDRGLLVFNVNQESYKYYKPMYWEDHWKPVPPVGHDEDGKLEF